ncbi:hypothetical protein MRB53_039754 [Persea americana]|nr:hypothetical protein MRB53_039754 [Persea americana]
MNAIRSLVTKVLPKSYGYRALFDADVDPRAIRTKRKWSQSTPYIAVVVVSFWSMTGYNTESDRPSIKNPLGNPKYPGETSANGANWVDYLTYNYNDSVVMTANFAVGGALIVEDLVAPGIPHVYGSMQHQVTDFFLPTHVNDSSYAWEADSSIFLMWIGINDIHDNDESTYQFFPKMMSVYSELAEQLFDVGARNFVFMNVPPLELMPIAGDTPEDYENYAVQTSAWNKNLTEMARTFTSAHDDVTTFVFDAHTLFTDIIDHPGNWPQSSGLKETVDYCLALSFGNKVKDKSCVFTINQYLWMNPLHPTTVAHNVTAAVLAEALRVAGSGDEVD